MEHAKLFVHRGATRVTRAELAAIEAPPATATWKPIKHAVLVGAIHEELAQRNITVVQEDYAVQRRQSMLFGVMVLNYSKRTNLRQPWPFAMPTTRVKRSR